MYVGHFDVLVAMAAQLIIFELILPTTGE